MPKVQPKVTLLSHTPNPEKTVASAAKLCYSSASLGDLMDNLTEEKASDFVQMLAEIGHESPIEHASFTFGIEGVSRAFLAQITRHRMASYSVQSQRYVREKAFDYVLPPEIEADDEALSEFEEAMEAAQERPTTASPRSSKNAAPPRSSRRAWRRRKPPKRRRSWRSRTPASCCQRVRHQDDRHDERAQPL